MNDWQVLGEALESRLRVALGTVRALPLAGGDINRAWRLETAAGEYFVKTNRAERLPMFEAERQGLQVIRDSNSVRVPESLATGCIGDQAYIVMEYIELGGRPPADALARQLAAMHACCETEFGFACDNTIGSTPQPNPRESDWVRFWRHQRLGFQLRLAARNRLDNRLLSAGERLNDSLERFFESYRPRASLLHGDLWSGNMAADRSGNPVVYDPACYYGDHEADLAMMELFGGPGERFFSIYAEQFAIDPGYATRRDLYNLYHLLNHANLFGGGYPEQSLRLCEKLLAQI